MALLLTPCQALLDPLGQGVVILSAVSAARLPPASSQYGHSLRGENFARAWFWNIAGWEPVKKFAVDSLCAQDARRNPV